VDADQEFLARFEACTIDARAFGHRQHIRMVWLYLRQEESSGAWERVRAGIRRLASAHGSPGLYHETLTWIWFRLVENAVASTPGGAEFDGFVAAHPELLDRELPYLYYSREVLMSEEARRERVAPDLRPTSDRVLPREAPGGARPADA
jgi:hypothetical protein